MFHRIFAALLFFVASSICIETAADEPLRLAAFNVDATPPLGSPVAYAPTKSIQDPLYARGIVLLSDKKPIVLCAVDWIGIGNGGYDEWRAKLAAAGTTPDRVAVHTLHQHDAPRCDFSAEAILEMHGLGGTLFSPIFANAMIEKTAAAIRESLKNPQPVTHVGVGKAKVEKVASNRRILGKDGKVKIVRWSKSTNVEAIAAPEGVIDPYVRLVSFWREEKPLASLTYYACHPQSYYGQGHVTSDFPGIARTLREKETPGLLHVHFNGAGGNVAAGKYNDGSEKMRPILAQRLADGMARAWANVKMRPIAADDLEWRVVPVKLPLAPHLRPDELSRQVADESADEKSRRNAALHLAWAKRAAAGREIELSMLRLGDAYILHMPGELFVEYQLAAAKMRPDAFVCMAAYGDYGPGYIGTEIAYSQGGYETSPRASRVAERVEQVLLRGMESLLR